MSNLGRMMIPKLPRRVTSRNRLLAALHRAIGDGVILLEAPAGYGKTTLLAQFAADIDYNVRWLTLDSSSGSPEVLAHQLGMAISGSTDIEAPAVSAKVSDLQAYVYAEVACANSKFERPLLLIIDNMHELVDAREASHLLTWLLASMPEGNEVVLAGRERPFLPQLNSRIATGELTLLSGSELAFDSSEVEEAVKGVAAAAPAAEIVEATGGWPVGVMAALSGANSSDVMSSAAFDKYLEREVWAQVPADLQDALRRFSLQPTIARAAVEAELGQPMWRAITQWLSTRDFLCEHLSAGEFRLNPLLRQFIANEFDRLDPDGYAAAFQVVIEDLVREGNFAEAVEFTRAGGTEQQLVELLEARSPQLIIQGALTLLLRAFECVSEPTVRRRPLLRGMYARVIAHVGDPTDAIRRADGILRDPAVAPEPKAYALLAKMRSQRLLGRQDDTQKTVAQLTELEPTLGASLRAEVTYHLAEFDLSVTRDFLKAEAMLREVIKACERSDIEPLGLLARSTLGQSLAMRGDAPEAVTVLTRAAQGWRTMGRSSNLGWVLNNLGMAHLTAGDFASSAAVLEEAVQEGINCGNQRNVGYATGSLGDAEVALGHFDKARVHYEETIRICATEALDESLAALGIAGLSAALLGLGDVQQADFFSRRAMLVALSSANSYELAICKLQQAAVEFAAGNLVVCVTEASEAAERLEHMEVLPTLAVAHYRIAMAHFKAGKRAEAGESLERSAQALKEPWMAAALLPLVRENPMFAQWAATRRISSTAFADMLERQSFEAAAVAKEAPQPVGSGRFPAVVARSLGRVSVSVAGRELSDEEWASARAKEMFFLLLSNREGIRKEQAVEYLYPEISPEKTNSAFHSNLYRIRRALYQNSVIKANDGIYQLNPEGTFEWDVEQFDSAIDRARQSQAGSRERAVALQEALELYNGPFAGSFQSEWAQSIRARLDDEAQESLATLAGYFAGREDFESAAICMERVLKANRYNEEAAYQLARYRSRAGQVVQALRFIDDFGSSYAGEFGQPLPERFGDLRAAIAAGVAV